MAHAIWSGAINFGLVTIPVKLFTAVKTDDLSFNMLHAKDEGRIRYERICSVDGKPVPWDEIVKGYEYEKGQYVILTDEDFAKVNPEATQSVDILEFVELEKINPMFFDKPYYLEPTKQGRHAYALLREALENTNRVAIARVVIRTKEYIAAVKPINGALVLELMHWANEIVETDSIDLPGREKLPEKEMKMARMLIDTMSADEFEPEKFTNKYHDELLTMIDARAEGKELPTPKKAPARAKVVNLMDVLAQSLEESKKRRAGSDGRGTTTKRRKKTAA
ncbi:MAG: Ku protein [Candidatus Eremiobacteraeota bacterium]|nr:Ku protein [Candidatus Eremiobacteraeota bacterium]MBV9055631.1 Ku protein [Candidatus Eremiobacteraeota bacterium]